MSTSFPFFGYIWCKTFTINEWIMTEVYNVHCAHVAHLHLRNAYLLKGFHLTNVARSVGDSSWNFAALLSLFQNAFIKFSPQNGLELMWIENGSSMFSCQALCGMFSNFSTNRFSRLGRFDLLFIIIMFESQVSAQHSRPPTCHQDVNTSEILMISNVIVYNLIIMIVQGLHVVGVKSDAWAWYTIWWMASKIPMAATSTRLDPSTHIILVDIDRIRIFVETNVWFFTCREMEKFDEVDGRKAVHMNDNGSHD